MLPPKAEVRVFILNVDLKFKSAIQIIKVVGWISEVPFAYLRSYGGWRCAYPPYGPIAEDIQNKNLNTDQQIIASKIIFR